MDIILLITAVLVVFLIIGFYVINSVKKTNDLNVIFESLARLKPDTVSFCLGKSSNTNKYKNVTADQDGNPIVRVDDYPVNLDGGFIILKNHGDVTELPTGNGFKISGVELVDFKCPDGFEGVTCKLKPICTDNDAGQYKALTYTQFNELGIYVHNFSHTNIQASARSIEPTHPRIRVLCTNNFGSYELQTCPNNTLLDGNLKCQPYDICEDRINGYKHNFKISTSSPELEKNTYYICDNNASSLTKCSEGTVFSMSNSGCITELVCYNRGNDTLPIDENSYIQCANDQGKTIICDDGIVNDNGVLSCKVNTCIPQDYNFSNGMLKYKYGDIVCNDGVSNIKICNNAPNPKAYDYEWAEQFTYKIESWPKEIMDSDRNCVVPTDDIIDNPVIKMQFTEAMIDDYDFNLKTEMFVCPDDTKYVIDYKNQTVIPPTDEILNHLTPCQNEIADLSSIQFQLIAPPFPQLYMFMYVPIYIDDSDVYFWPEKSNSSTTTPFYLASTVVNTDSELEITTLQSTILPLGFSDSDSDRKLLYNGYAAYETKPNSIYYFACSGKYEFPVLYEPTVIKTQKIAIRSSVITTESSTFALDMNQMSTTTKTIIPNLKFSRKEFKLNDITYPAGYIKATLTYISETSATLQIGGLDILTFSPTAYPTLTF